jgi:hypothetical protein
MVWNKPENLSGTRQIFGESAPTMKLVLVVEDALASWPLCSQRSNDQTDKRFRQKR